MEKTFIIDGLDQLQQLACKIVSNSFAGMKILLDGDLGAGKTTLSQMIGKELGITDPITSPTFTIMKIYQGSLPLYHFDVYRLNGDIEGLGFEEYFDGDGVSIIEWASMLEEDFDECLHINLTYLDETRREVTIKTSYEGDFYL